MNHAVKLVRFSSSSSTIFTSSSFTSTSRSRSAGRVGFVHVKSGDDKDTKPPKFTSMDAKKASEKDEKVDVMEESFGHGYATRSDEEGFGGVYGRNDEGDAEMKIVQDPAHEGRTLGSEVKEKEEEKARNQGKAGH